MTFGLGGSYFGLVMRFVLSNLAIFDFFDFYFPLVIVCNQPVTRHVVAESQLSITPVITSDNIL